MRLLVTRPSPDGELTAKRLQALGFGALHEPLMHVVGCSVAEWPEADALVITSINALRAVELPANLHGLPLWVVGARTAEEARRLRFSDVRGGEKDVAALALRMNKEVPRAARLLYLAGEHRAADLTVLLPHHQVMTLPVYRAEAARALSAPARDAMANQVLDGVLHYSTRSALIFLKLTEEAGLLQKALKIPHYCLSEAVAAPLLAAGCMRVRVTAEPNEEALFKLLL